MKYLFWNTHKNIDINPILRDLITENCISIVVLAEYTADINDLIRLLYDSGVIMEHIPTVGCDRIHILGRIESRNIAGKEFRMFYNPMWNFLGDFKEPYGTYYRSAADTFNPYWHIYDQVIIRPSLRSRFVDGNLKIITGSANVSLLDKNKHPNHSISDHLPITFEIKEDYHEQNT